MILYVTANNDIVCVCARARMVCVCVCVCVYAPILYD